MSFVGKLPRGLLSLLGIQNFGETPKQVAEYVQPTMELLELYALDGQVVDGNTGVAIVQGFNSLLTVPAGEVWRLVALSCIVVDPVGVTVGAIAPAVRVGAFRAILAPGVAAIASQTRWNTAQLASPLYLSSGTEIGVEADSVVGATTAFGITLLVSKLKA